MKDYKIFITITSLNLLSLLGIVTLLCLSGCAKGVNEAKANNSPRAILINGPSNYTCFAILNEQGTTVGGNCL